MARTKSIVLAPAGVMTLNPAKTGLEVATKVRKPVASKPGPAPARRRRAEPMVREPEQPTAEHELMQAMLDYKESSGRMFPTWSEVLEVLQSLGYRKPEAFPAELERVSESA